MEDDQRIESDHLLANVIIVVIFWSVYGLQSVRIIITTNPSDEHETELRP